MAKRTRPQPSRATLGHSVAILARRTSHLQIDVAKLEARLAQLEGVLRDLHEECAKLVRDALRRKRGTAPVRGPRRARRRPRLPLLVADRASAWREIGRLAA